jgi:hypothetical protein
MPKFEGIRALMLYGGVKILFVEVSLLASKVEENVRYKTLALRRLAKRATRKSARSNVRKPSGGCLDRFVSRQNIERLSQTCQPNDKRRRAAAGDEIAGRRAEEEANFRLEFNVPMMRRGVQSRPFRLCREEQRGAD